MTDRSPFSVKRYEHEGSHVYYIPPAAFRRLESQVPTYLVGTRGTGKTTLLHALSWSERLYNSSLTAQLGTHAFEDRYVGLYFKLPNVQLDLIDRWLANESDADYAALFSFYLDLCWLETAGPALKHLAARDIARMSPATEEDFLANFAALWRSYPQCVELVGEPGATVDTAFSLIHPLRRALERFARRRVPIADVLDALPAEEVGSFGRRIAGMISSAIDVDFAGADAGGQWSFRVCMDEGEVLTLRQQRVVNSMVRLTEWPLFYLIAYVSRPQDVTSTYLPNQTLQHADRQILVRDDMRDREFKQLAEGVVNVRLRAILQKKRVSLNTTRLLGKLDINDLLQRILRESEDRNMRSLLEDARDLQSESDQSPPIYELYLRRRRPELSSEPTSQLERRRQSSASIRKQMVAAYLSICREANTRPMYASADMVFQIADKCVRDYLWQMESIFSLVDKPLHDFLDAEVGAEVQDVALRSAAGLKMTLFRERVLSTPAEANQFVDGLARITALIQSTGRNAEQIRTPERGIFVYQLRPGGDAQGFPNFERLIRDASEAGFLKLMDDSEKDELKFRVHASLAPHYGFSYRGAYYAAGTLSDRDIGSLGAASTDAAMIRAVSSIVTRITGRRSKQVPQDQLDLEGSGGAP